MTVFIVTFYHFISIDFMNLRIYSFYEVRLTEAGFTNNNNNKLALYDETTRYLGTVTVPLVNFVENKIRIFIQHGNVNNMEDVSKIPRRINHFQ